MDTTAQVDTQALLDQNPDAVVFADTAGVIRYWNAAAERIFGFTAGDALGSNLDIIIPEPFRQRHWAGYERALAAGETKYRGQSLPTKAQKADGTEFYVELSFEIVQADNGTVVGAMATARDITERFERERETRRELRELKERAVPPS
jgi:PAS domain S-box-containing protein